MHKLLISAAMAAAHPLIMFADNGSDSNAAEGAGASPATTAQPTAQPAAQSTPATKRYLATATYRGEPKEGSTDPKEVKFVIEAADYKKAWEGAREVTRVGTRDLEGVTVFGEDGETALEMKPGRYTVKEVSSLQDRTRKQPSITIDQLQKFLSDRGVKPSKQVQELIEELRSNPGALTASLATSGGDNTAGESQQAANG